LLHGPALKDKLNISGLVEFLVHGLKYAFPAEHGEVTRGVATSYAAEPLKSEIASSNDLPPVWPWPDGETRGVSLDLSTKACRMPRYVIPCSTNFWRS
jgi:hypothetical protein